MSKGTPDCITEQYLIVFGTVIHWFARHEGLMQEIMATISGADVTSIKLLTSGLNFTEKRHALFSLLRHRAVPVDQIDQIQNYIEVLHTYSPLRNDIAHSVWIEGKPQNSIWPAWLKAGPGTAIKPMREIGDDAKGFIEDEEDKVTYTLDNLKEIVEILERNYVGFQEYVAGTGLISANPV
ncbi:MAG TPA: hypothetical protein VMU78_02770 [Methylocella sp.]|nr:hypothetical protein [Methylocella sp.]